MKNLHFVKETGKIVRQSRLLNCEIMVLQKNEKNRKAGVQQQSYTAEHRPYLSRYCFRLY